MISKWLWAQQSPNIREMNMYKLYIKCTKWAMAWQNAGKDPCHYLVFIATLYLVLHKSMLHTKCDLWESEYQVLLNTRQNPLFYC